ncbi:CRISPR-associated exonuclease Cas4/endonuclease Cas1 fusion [Anaerolineae bacterium]|nr:CRISPR-associated exonuclease Cas4/endonuclease Cas1 fusion [Anaerolineae bacterium]
MELPDYIPISMLNAFEYCPRRFWIEFVDAEMEINAHVLEGQIKHERAHTAGVQQEGDELTVRRLYVYSDQLRVTGFVDLVEIDAERGVIAPVEYKKGSMGKWLNDHIQLCAQAMCLEERLEGGNWKLEVGDPTSNIQLLTSTRSVQYGFVFYFGSRRRERVEFDQPLRDKTMETIKRIWDLLNQGQMPAPIDKYAKCRECSLEPICLPREVRQLVQ